MLLRIHGGPGVGEGSSTATHFPFLRIEAWLHSFPPFASAFPDAPALNILCVLWPPKVFDWSLKYRCYTCLGCRIFRVHTLLLLLFFKNYLTWLCKGLGMNKSRLAHWNYFLLILHLFSFPGICTRSSCTTSVLSCPGCSHFPFTSHFCRFFKQSNFRGDDPIRRGFCQCCCCLFRAMLCHLLARFSFLVFHSYICL